MEHHQCHANLRSSNLPSSHRDAGKISADWIAQRQIAIGIRKRNICRDQDRETVPRHTKRDQCGSAAEPGAALCFLPGTRQRYTRIMINRICNLYLACHFLKSPLDSANIVRSCSTAPTNQFSAQRKPFPDLCIQLFSLRALATPGLAEGIVYLAGIWVCYQWLRRES